MAEGEEVEMVDRFWSSVTRRGPYRWHNATRREWDHGVVYAAMGDSSLQKASASALSIRAAYGHRRDFGLLAITSEKGLDALQNRRTFDMAASIEGHGIVFSDVPQFYAFTSVQQKEVVVNEKARNWRWIRLLRSAKIVAIAIALQVFQGGAIFLDADTQICGPILSKVMAPILESKATIAFVPASRLHHAAALENRFGLKRKAPPPEPNTGVLAVGQDFFPLLHIWLRNYWTESSQLESQQNPMDQPSLRLTLASKHHTISYARLPASMNCRGHVRNLRMPLPLRCDGFSSSAHAAVIEQLSRRKTQHSIATPSEISTALKNQGGTGCHVIHSHALPWPRPPSSTQFNPHICRGNQSLSGHLVVLLDASGRQDTRCRPDQSRRLITGPYALETARMSKRPVALVLLLGKTPTSLIDLLSPLWPQEIKHEEPRLSRRIRLGSPSLADAADLIQRLDQDFTLILDAQLPEVSNNMARLTFSERPEIYQAIKSHLECFRTRSSTSIIRHEADASHEADSGDDLRYNTMIFEAALRLFKTQRRCLLR